MRARTGTVYLGESALNIAQTLKHHKISPVDAEIVCVIQLNLNLFYWQPRESRIFHEIALNKFKNVNILSIKLMVNCVPGEPNRIDSQIRLLLR